MNYSVIPSHIFQKQAKKLIKKYSSLKIELQTLEKILLKNPEHGIALGNETFKIKLVIKSKNKGKSGGARILTYKITSNCEVYLFTIYDKSEIENIDDKLIKKLIEEVKNLKSDEKKN